MMSLRCGLMISAILMLASASLQAKTIVVPDDHTTIQSAIDAAAGGDTVIVRPGTYFENIDFGGKAVRVASEQGAHVTIIDGGRPADPYAASVATFDDGEGPDSILEGFTITNGSGLAILSWSGYYRTYGAGIYCEGASPGILNNIIELNSADIGGGICCLASSGPLIEGNTITINNAGESGGGIYFEDSAIEVHDNTISNNKTIGVCFEYSSGSFTGNEITGNQESGLDGNSTDLVITNNTISANTGNGIYAYAQAATIEDNTIEGNGLKGIYIRGFNNDTTLVSRNLVSGNGEVGIMGKVRVTECTVTMNGSGIVGEYTFIVENSTIADNEGTGISCGEYDFPVVWRCSITGNAGSGIACYRGEGGRINQCAIEGNGRGVSVSTRDGVEVSECVISGNAGYKGGHGIYCSDEGDILVTDCEITGNATDGCGGGAFSDDESKVELVSCFVADNTAADCGGGCYADDDSVVNIKNCVLTGNTAQMEGGGASADWSSKIRLRNCTFVNNTAGTEGGGIYSDGANIWTWNSIVRDNNAPSGPQIGYTGLKPGVNFSNINGGWQGNGNIDADPLFADAAARDFHLTFYSPCIDKASNDEIPDGLDHDNEGDPRIAGGGVDMGADEFHPHLYHLGAVVPGQNIEVRIIGAPGTSPVRILSGAGLRPEPHSTPYGDLHLLQPIRSFAVGAIPSNGVLPVSKTVPGSWASGDSHPFQALLGPLGNPGTILTNTMILKVE